MAEAGIFRNALVALPHFFAEPHPRAYPGPGEPPTKHLVCPHVLPRTNRLDIYRDGISRVQAWRTNEIGKRRVERKSERAYEQKPKRSTYLTPGVYEALGAQV